MVSCFYSGMLPCFFGGLLSFLFRLMSSACIILMRVSHGCIISSMYPSRAAGMGLANFSWYSAILSFRSSGVAFR